VRYACIKDMNPNTQFAYCAMSWPSIAQATTRGELSLCPAKQKEDPAFDRPHQTVLAGERRRLWLPKITDDLHELGECWGKYPIYRVMRADGLRSQTGYHRPGKRHGNPSVVAPNHVEQ
jgi:hypothetical protein